MKAVQMFKCEICHTLHETESKAHTCEKSHALPWKFDEANVMFKYEQGKKFPVYIKVSFNSGGTKEYVEKRNYEDDY